MLKESLDELKSQTVNGCWKFLWQECVKDFAGFAPSEQVDESIRRTFELAQIIGGEGFNDMEEQKVRDLIVGLEVGLTKDELVELVRSASEEEEQADPDEAPPEPAALTLEKLVEGICHIEQAKALFSNKGLCIVRALKVNAALEDAIIPYRMTFKDLKQARLQLPITVYLTQQPQRPVTDPSPVPAPVPNPDDSGSPPASMLLDDGLPHGSNESSGNEGEYLSV